MGEGCPSCTSVVSFLLLPSMSTYIWINLIYEIRIRIVLRAQTVCSDSANSIKNYIFTHAFIKLSGLFFPTNIFPSETR